MPNAVFEDGGTGVVIEIKHEHVVADEGTKACGNGAHPGAEERSEEEGDDNSRENKTIAQECAATRSEMPVGDNVTQRSKENSADDHSHDLRYTDTPRTKIGGSDRWSRCGEPFPERGRRCWRWSIGGVTVIKSRFCSNRRYGCRILHGSE